MSSQDALMVLIQLTSNMKCSQIIFIMPVVLQFIALCNDIKGNTVSILILFQLTTFPYSFRRINFHGKKKTCVFIQIYI